jgi:hypothetical protein
LLPQLKVVCRELGGKASIAEVARPHHTIERDLVTAIIVLKLLTVSKVLVTRPFGELKGTRGLITIVLSVSNHGPHLPYLNPRQHVVEVIKQRISRLMNV